MAAFESFGAPLKAIAESGGDVAAAAGKVTKGVDEAAKGGVKVAADAAVDASKKVGKKVDPKKVAVAGAAAGILGYFGVNQLADKGSDGAGGGGANLSGGVSALATPQNVGVTLSCCSCCVVLVAALAMVGGSAARR